MSVKGFKLSDGTVVKYDYSSLDNIITDSTLSVDGVAADAGAVGDELLSLQNKSFDLDELDRLKLTGLSGTAGETTDKIAQLTTAIGTEASTRVAADAGLASDIAVERARITNLATLTDGSTTGDAELADIRVGDDGVTYSSAGDAVRGQIADVKSDLSAVCPTPSLTWILNRNVDGAGNISTNNYMAVTDVIPCSVGDIVVRKTPSAVNNKSLIGYISQFNGNTFIKRSSFNTYGESFVIDEVNTTNIRIAFGRASSSGVQITQDDVDTYFDVEIYRKATTFTEYNTNGFINRGSFSALGYTSISSCIKPGFYTFGSSDIIDDLPIGWTGGGLVTVYSSGTTIWQKLERLVNTFIRYGVTGKWYNKSDLLYVQYTSEAGDDSSIAHVDIYIPRSKSNLKTMYRMGHCVDTNVNADVWRILSAYRQNYNDTLRKLTIRGEWECAVHLENRDDFSGGIVHGDEVDTNISVFVDGTVTGIDSLNHYCQELKIIRHSNLYDPNDHTTIIAEHGVEYIYNVDGLIINQSIEWKTTATLTNCYLAMLPIAKAYSTHRYDDTNFDIVENNQSSYSVNIPNARSVTEFNETYDCLFTMSVPTYPTGLQGGDCALISDNGGLGYNKVYFPVCSSGSVQSGDLWKSTTVFRNK